MTASGDFCANEERKGIHVRMKRLLALLLMMTCLAPFALGETVSMTFVGDCTIGCDVDWLEDERAFPNVIAREGMDYPFANVSHLFEEDDLTVINLEGVLADDDTGIMGGRKYNFRGETAYTKMLTDASVELAVLGNNHAFDFGRPGHESTKAALTQAGIGYAYNDEPYIFEKNGVRIGVLSYLADAYSERMKRMPEIIRALREEEGCAAVVVCVHAGTEYKLRRSSGQRGFAHAAINAGADLYIGHHPHVLQGLEVYQNRNIVYSLGNFVFGGNRRILSEHKHTMVARVEMTFEAGVYTGQRLTIHPAIATGTLDRNNYQPYLATGEEAKEVMRILNKDSKPDPEPYVEGVGAVQMWLGADGTQEE